METEATCSSSELVECNICLAENVEPARIPTIDTVGIFKCKIVICWKCAYTLGNGHRKCPTCRKAWRGFTNGDGMYIEVLDNDQEAERVAAVAPILIDDNGDWSSSGGESAEDDDDYEPDPRKRKRKGKKTGKRVQRRHAM